MTTFRKIPISIEKLNLSIASKYILSILYDYQIKGSDLPSKANMAQTLGISRQTAYRAFKELESADFIEVVSNIGKKDIIKVNINNI